MAESASVRVICRFRPINNREKKEFMDAGKDPNQMICKFVDDLNCEIALEEGLGTKKYCFDRVYPPGVPQRDVYNLSACDTIVQVINGYNGTILSYGQTGAGKSFSMFGTDINDQEMKGIIPRSGDHIFNHITTCDNKQIEWNIRCSFMEIYNEKVNDLLARGPDHEDLRIRESPERGIYVEGATETQVCTVEDIAAVINIGDSNRAVSSTAMNAVSSRSHTVLMIFVRSENKADSSKQEGKMCLVDLAGSEKTSKTNAEGARLAEANAINGSLTTLGQCIKMLAEGDKGHVPFRNSKLTRLLQESLGGNSKTTLLIACSPHPFNREETISTCEFGKRAKSIKNKVKVNATKSVKELMAIIDKMTVQMTGQDKYIKLCDEAIKWYQENATGIECGCYIPTKADLALLMEGKELKALGGDAADTDAAQDEEAAEHFDGAINDASVRIASLQSQLDQERQAKYLMKENYEADFLDLKRKLDDAQNEIDAIRGGDSSYIPSGGNNEGGNGVSIPSEWLNEMKQLRIQRDALKKKLRIYEEGVDEDDEDQYEEEGEMENENAEGIIEDELGEQMDKGEDDEFQVVQHKRKSVDGRSGQENEQGFNEGEQRSGSEQRKSIAEIRQSGAEHQSGADRQSQNARQSTNNRQSITKQTIAHRQSIIEKREKQLKDFSKMPPVKAVKAMAEELKKLQEKIDQHANKMQEQEIKNQQKAIEMEEQVKQLDQLNKSLRADNNRIRGIAVTEEPNAEANQEDTNLSESDRLIRQMEGELKQNRNAILIMRRDILSNQFLQQRFDQLQEKLVQVTKKLAQKEDEYNQLANSQKDTISNVQRLDKSLQIKNSEAGTLNERLLVSDERAEYLTSQLGEITNTISKIKKEKADALREKDEDTRRIMLDFEKQKQKLQDTLMSKQSRVYKPVQGLSVAQQLAQSNPDIVQRLKNLKSNWTNAEEE